MIITVASDDFDVGQEYQRIKARNPNAGAIVVFVGLVREFDQPSNKSQSPRVSHLELEHYVGMTENLMLETAKQAQQRFNILDADIYHRVGELQAADQIVLVAIASLHRSEAFDAAQYVMDYLKTTATIWKKEVSDQGSMWLGLKPTDAKAAHRWQSE